MKKTDFSFLPDYAKQYIQQIEEYDLMEALINGKIAMYGFLQNIPENKMNYSYALGKWTIKEVLTHLIDSERIMAYRALCIARGETQSLPSFDENQYVAASCANERSTASFYEEYLSVRDATLSLFKYIDPIALQKIGSVNHRYFSPLSLGFIIAGHERHHIKILKERYSI